MLWSIDASCGGKDLGAKGIINKDNIYEKDLSLIYAKMFGEELKKINQTIMYTRTTDAFITLKNRVELVKFTKPDVFISFQFNASLNKKTRGSEAWVYDIENLSPIIKDLGETMTRGTNFLNRGIIQKQQNFLLQEITVPRIIFKIGYLTNPNECYLCQNNKFQKTVITQLKQSVISYI